VYLEIGLGQDSFDEVGPLKLAVTEIAISAVRSCEVRPP
jgi:hypothetical protein